MRVKTMIIKTDDWPKAEMCDQWSKSQMFEIVSNSCLPQVVEENNSKLCQVCHLHYRPITRALIPLILLKLVHLIQQIISQKLCKPKCKYGTSNPFKALQSRVASTLRPRFEHLGRIITMYWATKIQEIRHQEIKWLIC